MINHYFQISSGYSEVTELIVKLHNLFMKNGINSQDRSELEICLVEALNNVVKHSYDTEPGNEIFLEVNFDEDSATFKIIDSGNSRTDFSKPSLEFDPNDIANLPEGGMGLYIIDKLMDKTSYTTERGKNIFTMTKNFQHKLCFGINS